MASHEQLQDELLRLRHAQPFTPFELVTSAGGRFRVDRPSFVFDDERAFVFGKGVPHTKVSLKEVTEIHRVENGNPRSASQ